MSKHESSEKVNFRRGIDKQRSIQNESNIFNSVSQKTPKMNKENRSK
jgi:hypothetical protein